MVCLAPILYLWLLTLHHWTLVGSATVAVDSDAVGASVNATSCDPALAPAAAGGGACNLESAWSYCATQLNISSGGFYSCEIVVQSQITFINFTSSAPLSFFQPLRRSGEIVISSAGQDLVIDGAYSSNGFLDVEIPTESHFSLHVRLASFSIRRFVVNGVNIISVVNANFTMESFNANLNTIGDYFNSIVRVRSRAKEVECVVWNSVLSHNEGTDDAAAPPQSGSGLRIYGYVRAFIVDSQFFNNKLQVLLASPNFNLIVYNCYFEDNTATSGSSIYFYRGFSYAIKKSWFARNKALSNGGAIYLDEVAQCTIIDSTFVDNAAQNFGGVIYSTSSSLDVSMLSVQSSVANYGPAIYVDGSNFDFNCIDSTFSGSQDWEAGIMFMYPKSANILIENSCFYGYTSWYFEGGGAISLVIPMFVNLRIANTIFLGNNAYDGGALSILVPWQCDVVIQDSIFENNYAKFTGGGIALTSSVGADILVQSSSFKHNLAFYGSGGALFIDSVKDSKGIWQVQSVTVESSRFEGNEAVENGGAIFIGPRKSNSSIFATKFISNRAGKSGGAIFSRSIFQLEA